MRFEQVWGEARIRRIRDVTPSVREFEFVAAGGAPRPHQVGSHVNVGVIVGGQPDIRSYSVVGESGRDCYRIAVKRQAESRGGSAYMWSLPEGATLPITDPHALFSIEYDRSEYLLVVGGIGITPLVGMALQLARRGARMRLLYAARRRDELAFRPELEAAGVEVMSDCRRGECGICALDVVSRDGEIDHRDVFFSDAQRHEPSEGVRLRRARDRNRHDRQGRRPVDSTGLRPDTERETRS